MSIFVQLAMACVGAGILIWLLERMTKKRKGRAGETRPMQSSGLSYLKDIPKRKWCQDGVRRADLRVLGEEDFKCN